MESAVYPGYPPIRLLARLKQKRAITTHHRELVITDTEKLTRLANYDSMAVA